MTIGETIRKIRRARDITQEQLAEILHITPQAVSRWETDTTVPDVSSLIQLTRVFDCTADDILGINTIKKQDKIISYTNQIMGARYNGDGDRAIQLSREALDEFPGEYRLMIHLISNLSYYAKQYKDNSDIERYTSMLNEAKALCETILSRCADEKILNEARFFSMHIFGALGEYEKAEQIAESLPSLNSCREFALAIYAKDRHEANLFLAEVSYDKLMDALQYLMANQNSKFTPEERVETAEKMEALHRLFYGDITATIQPSFYIYLSWAYAYAEDTTNTLRYLRKAADIAVDYDVKHYNQGYGYKIDEVPFKGEYMSVCSTDRAEGYWEEMRKYLTDERYDFVRGTPEFEEILNLVAA